MPNADTVLQRIRERRTGTWLDEPHMHVAPADAGRFAVFCERVLPRLIELGCTVRTPGPGKLVIEGSDPDVEGRVRRLLKPYARFLGGS